jgi:hypothetical protein
MRIVSGLERLCKYWRSKRTRVHFQSLLEDGSIQFVSAVNENIGFLC